MTTPHTEMHFGPSWMQNSSRARSFTKAAGGANAPASEDATPSSQGQVSYSSVIRDVNGMPNGQAVPDQQPEFADAAHPFRYSKEYMLGLWQENKDRELPIEFERWEVIFRPEAGMPSGLKDLDEVERRAFSGSFNPERRPTASTANSSASLATLGDLKLDPPARRRQVTGGDALNSPVRERFGGIQGGVLGGLGMGAKDSFAGSAAAAKGVPRRKDEATAAPLPPSSTTSWRPTRQLSSNLPEPVTPSEAPAAAAEGRRWRTGTEEPALAPASERAAAAGGGFNANASRAGGWRERERMKKAETDLSTGAGWTSVDKAADKKTTRNGGAGDDKPNADYSNAYSALDQEEDDAPADPSEAPAVPQASQEELEKEALKLVNWTYKDPSGNVQGPFPAKNMHDWNQQGYFVPSLLVKRESDVAYETVATLTLLSPDPNEIFFQRPVVKAPAPPGLHPTTAQMLGLGAVSTPLVSPLVGFADPALIERNPVDQFMQQGENPAGRWGVGTPTHQHAQPFGNGLAQQSPFQQHAQPAFDPAAQLFGQRTPARHPFQDPNSFSLSAHQSPYASPIVQHQAPSPWNQQHAQPTPQPFFGMGGPQYGAAPNNGTGFGYPGMGNVGLSGGEPWAGNGAGNNDWRNIMSPGGQNVLPQQQHQLNYAQDLMAQQQQQHQQQQQMWPPANQAAPHQSLAPGAPESVTPAPQAEEVAQPAAAAEIETSKPASAWGKVPTQAVESLPIQDETPVQEPAPGEAYAPTSAAAASPVKVAAPQQAEKPVAAALPAPAKATKAEKKAAAAAAAAAAVAAPAVVAAEPVERSQPSPAPKVAPWAKIEEESAIPSPSLRDIQQAEALKAATANPKKVAQPVETVKSFGSPTSITTLSWGLNGSNSNKPAVAAPAPATSPAPAPAWQTSTSTPSKTLKQIQEEEARQKAKAAQLKAAQNVSLGNAAAKAAYAGAVNTAAAQTNAAASAWSTVGSGGKPVAAAARPAASVAPVVAARPAVAAPKSSVITSIQSSNSMTRTSSAASVDEATPSAEFLAWARIALKSVTGVNLDEFLQMLLSFPLNPDPIVMEIISDSVYANSSTLDGRRFAQEFVAKRKADAKAQKAGTVAPVGRGSSLADIVKAQPKPAADSGFGAFKVVKKKGRH